MARRGIDTPARRLRRHGIRVSAGAWVVCGDTAQTRPGRLIVSLGRTAGGAVTRSRARRIAREVLADACLPPRAADLLVLARSEVSRHPRRQMRSALKHLLDRLRSELTRRDTERVRS